jgi:predicted tellurium resistance membrane protein TerC
MESFFLILYLVFIEGILSLDNALALAAIVNRELKDPREQKIALRFGIIGAYAFRILVILIGVEILHYSFSYEQITLFPIRLIAGLYLLWLAFSELRPHES